MPATALWMGAFVLLGALFAILFPDRSMEQFVVRGVPCLRLGALSAFAAGLLGWPLLRRGYLVSPRETVALYGFFAGLVGVAVLALHCPLLNSAHCLVWHLGGMLIAGLAGVLIGRYLEARRA